VRITLVRPFPMKQYHKWHVSTGSGPLCGIVLRKPMLVPDVDFRAAEVYALGSEVCVQCRRKMGAIL